MLQTEYLARMFELIKTDNSDRNDLNLIIMNAHNRIEEETKTFINLSLDDIFYIKNLIVN